MARLKIFDAFETKAQAQKLAQQLKRKDKVQFVRVRRIGNGRLKWGVFLGGRGSSIFV